MLNMEIRKKLFTEQWVVKAERTGELIQFSATVTTKIGPFKLHTKNFNGVFPCDRWNVSDDTVRIVGLYNHCLQDVILPSVIVRKIMKQLSVNEGISGHNISASSWNKVVP